MHATELDELDEAEVRLKGFLTFRMARLQAKLNKQATHILQSRAGLTLTQWRIMALIGSNGRMTAAKVTRSGLIDKGLFSRKLKTLVAEGLVQVQADDFDQRIQHLSLTKRGQSVYETTMPIMKARQDGLRSALSPEENDMIDVILTKLDRAAEHVDYET